MKNPRTIVILLLHHVCLSLLGGVTSTGAVFPEAEYPWRAKEATDKRSPCPALNSLANHGYIFRNGTDIPISLIAQAGERVYSVAEPTLLNILNHVIQAGIQSEQTEDGELTLTLSDLYPHNIVEHDGSLTRLDEYFEPFAQFNSNLLTKLLETNTTADSLTLNDAVYASQQRIIDSRLNNPNVSFTHNPILPIQMADEKLFLMLVGSDSELEYINKSDVEEFFTYDRIPQGHVPRQELGLEPINLVDDFAAELRNGIAVRMNSTMAGPLPTSSAERIQRSLVLGMSFVLMLSFAVAICSC